MSSASPSAKQSNHGAFLRLPVDMPMRFCSECGSVVKLQIVKQEQNRERYVCASCNTTHYDNPRIIVCLSICWRGRVLMCRRSQEPGLGKWAVPSGFLECGETLEEAAVRETLEETGVVIDPRNVELQSVINMVEIKQVAVAFRTDIDAMPVLKRGPECLALAFLAEDDIAPDELAWQRYLGDSTRKWFQEMRSHEYSIYLGTLGSNERLDFKSREYKISSVNQGGDSARRPMSE
jgi:ADP-ribose pyrophosphatase YjhB (NUDIX family)